MQIQIELNKGKKMQCSPFPFSLTIWKIEITMKMLHCTVHTAYKYFLNQFFLMHIRVNHWVFAIVKLFLVGSTSAIQPSVSILEEDFCIEIATIKQVSSAF